MKNVIEKPFYTKRAYEYILRFIRARNFNDTEEATRCQKWLKNHFGDQYSTVLLKHGDPDRNNYQDYAEVMTKWWDEYTKSERGIIS